MTYDPPLPPSWFQRHRRLLFGLLPPLLILTYFVGESYLERRFADGDLAAAIGEADRIDPRWRLADIERTRPFIVDEKNSALVIQAVRRTLPANWLVKVADSIEKVPPPVLLTAEQDSQLQSDLAPLREGLSIARKLVDYPTGRHRLNWTADYITTIIDEQQYVRSVVHLLSLDIRLLVQRGEMEQAWHSGRALLNAARSIGDEPLFISQLIRLAGQGLTIEHLERILAHGQVPQTLLADMQKELEDEANGNLFLIAIRGERAGEDHLLSNIENGTLSLTKTLDSFSRRKKPASGDILGILADSNSMPMVRRSHAWLLRTNTEVAEAAKLPDTEKYRKLKELDVRITAALKERDDISLARLLLPAMIRVAEAEQRLDTRLHCAAAALAAERYRLKNSAWPKSLEALVEDKLLKQVPLDLYTGQPLGVRFTTDGMVIYSASGKNYAGDALDNLGEYDHNQVRIEFRLWNADRRRQAPLVAKVKEQ